MLFALSWPLVRPARRPVALGFSLVELLVVVSILALLVSVLAPSLQNARAQTRAVVCLSNLRQVSHGWHMYADDNQDVSVPGRYAGAPGGFTNPANWYWVGNGLKFRPRWIVTMGRYISLYAYSNPRTDDDRQDYTSKVYLDPAVPGWSDERNHAWGYNYQFLGNARKVGDKFINFPVNRTRIRSFAGTVLGADSLGTASGYPKRDRKDYDNQGSDELRVGNHAWSLDPPRLTANCDRGSGEPGSRRTGADPRHLRKVNVAFCDGHGEAMSLEDLGYRTLPSGASVDQESVTDAPTNRLFSGSSVDADPPTLPR